MSTLSVSKSSKVNTTDILSEALEKSVLLGDWLSRFLTPKKLRTNKFLLGHIFIAIPFLLLFLPAIIYSINTSWLGFWISLTITIGVILIMSNWYVIKVKALTVRLAKILESILDNKSNSVFNKEITQILSLEKQLTWGVIFALSLIFYCYLQEPIRNLPPLIMMIVLVAVGYLGIILGSALHIVEAIRNLLFPLSKAKYRIKFLIPSKQLELLKISNLSSSFAFRSVLWTFLITLLVFILHLGIALVFSLNEIGTFLFLGFFEVFILLSTLGIISYTFFTIQIFLYNVVKHKKLERLKKLNDTIESLIDSIDTGNLNSIEPLSKIQSLYDLVEQSSDSVIEPKTILRFLSSIIIAILPIVLGIWIK